MPNITLNGTFLKNQFQESSISVTNAEVVLDGAINMLNAYNEGLDNLTGTAGSKTGSYTSAQVGKIMAVAQQIYQRHWKNASGANASVGNLSLNYAGDYQLLTFAKMLAREQTEPPISIGTDIS